MMRKGEERVGCQKVLAVSRQSGTAGALSAMGVAIRATQDLPQMLGEIIKRILQLLKNPLWERCPIWAVLHKSCGDVEPPLLTASREISRCRVVFPKA